MFHRILLLIGVSFLLLPGTLQAAEPESTATRVLTESGLLLQLSLLPEILQDGLEQGIAQSQLDPAEVDRLRQTGAEVITLAAMQSAATDTIDKNLDSGTREKILAWLSSPLGQKITQAEEAAMKEDVHAYITDLAPRLQPERLDQTRVDKLSRLDRALTYSEHAVDMILNARAVLGFALIAADQSNPPVPFDTIRVRLESQREQMAREIRPQLFATMYVTYMPLSDRELQQYILFAYSETGQAFLEASTAALDAALLELAPDLESALRPSGTIE